MAFNDFDESLGSPKFDFGRSSATAKRTGIINWSNIDALIDELFPPGGLLPAAYPTNDLLRVDKVQIEPISDEQKTLTSATNDIATVNTYDLAKVTIDYATGSGGNVEEPVPGGEPNPDPTSLLTHRWSIGGEFITIPSLGFEWKTDSTAVDRDIDMGILIPTIEHQVTWPRVINPPFTALRNTVGRVNSNEGSFSTGLFIPETLLFLGAELQREVLSTGALAWEVSYRFSERRVDAADEGVTGHPDYGGWNHFYRSDDPFANDAPKVGFYKIEGATTHTNAGKTPYELVNFIPLFVEGS